ncbi:Predicted chitinase [Pseudoxanthobacter soli DSM 19599]|uniref:Predicted chitinase n=1 Tax=Pseudoxanthobacter soli DSM 19599 TaxID=1123029 RepID=A0A1M7ZLM4_9HYPH|nr:peptidoglycan-binding protein [Pseudoxanthobacter soli]SHO65803.1 Predicted chitinase [Pseudoxanthobacter soli DSM 19599]
MLDERFLGAVAARPFGRLLTSAQAAGIEAILDAWRQDHAEGDPRQLAYVLATAYHETAGTMEPVAEYGGDEYKRNLYDVTGRDPARARAMGNTEPGDGPRYAGRGFVQLTWKNNYARAGRKLGLDLVGQPDDAMKPDIAARILVRGMAEGWFTGKKLGDYIAGAACDWKGARRIVNGTDKADLIAGYAAAFHAALASTGTMRPTLRRGAKGADVRALQGALRERGAAIEADGDYGARTEAAVRRYQDSIGLQVDGVAGARTWAALGL